LAQSQSKRVFLLPRALQRIAWDFNGLVYFVSDKY